MMAPPVLQKIRNESPLIHNITNYVVMNWTANVLLSIGASPVMAHASEEVEEMAWASRALVINIGTLSDPWIRSMAVAMETARRKKIPIVFDPVGAGATKFRTETCTRLMHEFAPTIIRGNASEIRALGACGLESTTKGVESTLGSETALDSAKELASSLGCVVSVSGKTDFIVTANRTTRIDNGHEIMTKVTGMGCAASALIAAFASVDDDAERATINAMTSIGIAVELAAEKCTGPGSFQPHFLDVLSSLDDETIARRARISPC